MDGEETFNRLREIDAAETGHAEACPSEGTRFRASSFLADDIEFGSGTSDRSPITPGNLELICELPFAL